MLSITVNIYAVLWLIAVVAQFISTYIFGETIITWGHNTEYHPLVVIVLSVIGMWASAKLNRYYSRFC